VRPQIWRRERDLNPRGDF